MLSLISTKRDNYNHMVVKTPTTQSIAKICSSCACAYVKLELAHADLSISTTPPFCSTVRGGMEPKIRQLSTLHPKLLILALCVFTAAMLLLVLMSL